eukprot:scaffold37193_cov64-Cyclotella_meneghiniana.AAC.1
MERYLHEMDRKWRGIYMKWTANGEQMEKPQMDRKWNGRQMDTRSQVPSKICKDTASQYHYPLLKLGDDATEGSLYAIVKGVTMGARETTKFFCD